MLGALATLFTWLWGLLHQKPPIAEKDAKDLGAASQSIASLEAENEELKAAAAARADAAAAGLRSDPSAEVVESAPGAPVNNIPGEVFRD